MLNSQLEAFILSPFPAASRIVDLQSYRPEYLFFPARVRVQQRDGTSTHCVLKLEEELVTLQQETAVAEMLATLGLPVATALADPLELAAPYRTDNRTCHAAILWSEVPGESLPWVDLRSLDEAYLTYRLLRQGVLTLHSLTEQVRRHPLAATLPTRTLQGELDVALTHVGRWLEIEPVERTLATLQRVIPAIQTPLVFSNGDYNAINFLHKDGALSGYVDFELTCFEDPYIGFAKMIFWSCDDYGWGAGLKAGIVERFLYEQGVSKEQFAPRLALRCLTQMMKDESLDKVAESRDAQFMLKVLEDCLQEMA